MPIFALLILLLSGLCFPALAQVASNPPQEREVFTVVEVPPKFPGGMNRLQKYLQKNLHYPQTAVKSRVDGKVYVSFIVTDQGTIEAAQVIKGLDPALDAEAIRVVQSMPKWVPGRQSGHAVTVRYNLPIDFTGVR